MKLTGLVLKTFYFEDYLSFLTEVLELNLKNISETEMLLDLDRTWLEIRKATTPDIQETIKVEFCFNQDDFRAIKQKISFFYYRKSDSRFSLVANDTTSIYLLDPDGRVWVFIQENSIHETPPASVRNC